MASTCRAVATYGGDEMASADSWTLVDASGGLRDGLEGRLAGRRRRPLRLRAGMFAVVAPFRNPIGKRTA